MKKGGGGVVVNIASVRAMAAGEKCLQYDTTKAAILGMTRSIARDHAADNIRVMAVAPGPIFTDFHEKRAEEFGQTHDEYKKGFGFRHDAGPSRRTRGSGQRHSVRRVRRGVFHDRHLRIRGRRRNRTRPFLRRLPMKWRAVIHALVDRGCLPYFSNVRDRSIDADHGLGFI